MFVKKIWDIKQAEVTEELIKAAFSSKFLARLLANRGINTKEKAEDFLNPMKSHISSPFVFSDMRKSVDRIKDAIEKEENITIYGDFDADGISSSSILYLTLKKIGAKVDYYLPDRAIESHGLNNKAIINIISKRKTKLIITVDCGISNVAEINLAKGLRTDVIVTDHHEAPDILPEAYAIINPKSPDSLKNDLECSELESLNCLSGAGVAFKLACALLEEYHQEEYVNEILPICAIGTIGDVVELTGENRRIVIMGLELLRAGKTIGIQKILKSAGIETPSKITSETIAYYVVPRINASGRLESPSTAFNIFVAEDENTVNESVKLLNDYNSLRQELCDKTFNQAKLMYENNLAQNNKSIILFSPDWHIGIIGIVCSKLVETYNKPSFLMTRDINNPNIIKCSCRSIEGINIHSVLSEHKELFEGFGGHKMAAGFSFDETKITFEQFKNILNKTIEEVSQSVDYNCIKIYADMIIEPEDITLKNAELINKLEPFGAMNPEALFIGKDFELINYRFMGQENNHLKMTLSKNGSSQFECVMWNCPKFNLPLNSKIDLLFKMQINSYNGNVSVQLLAQDFHSEYTQKEKSEIKILDHRNKKNIIIQVLDFISSTKKTTGIFLFNSLLKKQLNLTKDIDEKVFNLNSIPKNIEQLLFFDCPFNGSDFSKILKETDAKIIHLMNFNISEITTDLVISKLSGMIKYSMSNMNSIMDINRASMALNIDCETIDCAFTLLESCNMINFNKISEYEYEIISLTPVELSKIKNDEIYEELSERINNINKFRKFYLNSSVEEIKESLC